MALSIADYLLQLPENMNFAKVQELSGEGSLYYRMLSDYGSGSFQLIRFENDLLMILIADYTPKETFEKIATISEEYMEISQFETDSSSFKIGRRKTQPVGKGIYCYVNTQKTTYVYCEKGKPVRFTKIILTRKYFDTYFRVHYGKDYEQSKVAKEYLLKNPNLPELNFVFQQIRDCQAVGQTLHLYLESKVLELLSLVIKGMEQKENHIFQNFPFFSANRHGRNLIPEIFQHLLCRFQKFFILPAVKPFQKNHFFPFYFYQEF